MEDIRLAMGLIGFVSVACFSMTFRLLRGRSSLLLDVMAVAVVALLLGYAYTVWGQLWIVQWIPLPSVIILANWFPPLLGALAAVVWLRLETPIPDDASEEDAEAIHQSAVFRRLPVMTLIVVAAAYSVTYFVPKQPPACGDKWQQPVPPLRWPVCLQTTPHTCSAAAAATILNALGMETSEQEMAELCLTKSGTTWLGLYHGLSTKLLGTKLRVEFFKGDMETLQQFSAEHPVLLCCRLDAEAAAELPKYENNGWIPETAHSVVYFGAVNGLHVVGDPSMGYEIWEFEDMKTLWTGEGLRIRQ